MVVQVDVSAEPGVDNDSIELTLTTGASSFHFSGGGAGTRVASLGYDACQQSVPIGASASWKTKPVGIPPVVMQLTRKVSINYANHRRDVTMVPHPYPSNGGLGALAGHRRRRRQKTALRGAEDRAPARMRAPSSLSSSPRSSCR